MVPPAVRIRSKSGTETDVRKDQSAAAAKTAMAIVAGTMANANEAKTTPIQNQNPIQKARAQLTDTGTDSSYL